MYTDTLARDKGGMTALALARVNMEKLSWGGASADEAPHGLAVGRWVRATVTFTTNSEEEEEDSEEEEEAEEVPKGSLGVVAEIDQHGNAWIDFEGLDAKQCVLQSNFGSISVLSQEDVLKRSTQSFAQLRRIRRTWWRQLSPRAATCTTRMRGGTRASTSPPSLFHHSISLALSLSKEAMRSCASS